MQTISEKIQPFSAAALALGRAGLIVAEEGGNSDFKPQAAADSLKNLGYLECHDYLEIMDALAAGQKKIYYRERGGRLDHLVFEIAAEFESGVIGLADRKNNTGLKTARWNPADCALVIIMTRAQAEISHPDLFKYITLIQSL
jgi:hypothetical protein